ncbi:MAG TPA: TetR/AcrR family transcriptional regulator [Treponema sp.]|nr:TetR/AcrR family transcriptional regulator [Treponema sp.]
MEERTDLRVQRTYKLLTDSLIGLLSEKRFEDVAVGEICERAMVRRATFYKHFGDKYELFTFMIKELQSQFHKDNAITCDPKRPQTYYVGMVDLTLSFLEQNKTMVTSVVNSSASSLLLDLLSTQIEIDVCGKFKEDLARGAILPGKPELLALLFTGALVYLAKRWVQQNWKMSRDEITQECVKVLKSI